MALYENGQVSFKTQKITLIKISNIFRNKCFLGFQVKDVKTNLFFVNYPSLWCSIKLANLQNVRNEK